MICSNIWIDIKEAQLDGKPNRTLEHPDQKPIVLIERIIKASSNENDIILDCFAGSGTTGIACINTNRNYILIEKEEKYYNMINDRINKRITNDKTNS
jgi:DNA modification methylase